MTNIQAFRTHSDKPLYRKIFDDLRRGIVNGTYEEGSFLPSEPDLATAYGVSRITAKRALDEIAAAGLAVREQGRGTRVRLNSGTIVTGSIESLVESLQANGRYQVEILDFDYIVVSPEVSSLLGLGDSDVVQRSIRVWHHANLPFSHLTSYVPAEIGRAWTRADLARKTMTRLIEETGIIIDHAKQQISAELANKTLASVLKVEPGSPLLRIQKITYDVNNRPIQCLVALYAPDRYQFSINLSRESARQWS